MQSKRRLINIITSHNNTKQLSDRCHISKHRNEERNLDSSFGQAQTRGGVKPVDNFDKRKSLIT